MKINTQNTIALVNGQNVAVKRFYNTNDIVKTVLDVYNEYHSQAASIAPQLKDQSILKTCKNIYQFIRANVKYREDGNDKQVVAAPGRLLERGYGDCKSMTVLAASILKNLNIPFCIRFVGYKSSETPNQFTHVYVVVPTGSNTYITLDPVHHTFNQEVKGVSIYRDYSKGQNHIKNKTMKGNHIGIGRNYIGETWVQRKRRELKEDWEVAQQKIKTATLVPVRGAVLGLVRLNVLALASLINYSLKNDRKKYDEIALKWYNFGGNRTEFQRVVELGAKERPLGSNAPIVKDFAFIQRLRSKGVIKGFHNVGLTGAEVSAALVSAAPFIKAIMPLLIALSIDIPEPEFDEEGKLQNPQEIINSLISNLKNRKSKLPDGIIPTGDPAPPPPKPPKKDNTNLYIGLGATAAIALFLIPTIKK
jgi:hypothetical protein